MEEPYADNLAILRAALTTRELPPEVIRWALEVATDAMSNGERTAQRNRYLRAAADMMSGSVEAKASRIREEAMRLTRAWPLRRHEAGDLTTPRGCILTALQLDSAAPLSVAQLRRIITARLPR